METLGRWWSKKYHLPSNHELFTKEDVIYWLTEYYTDFFEDKPIEIYRQEDGEIKFTETGDDLIDEWEEQIARGETPDLTQAFSKESLEAIRTRKTSKHLQRHAGSIADTVKMFENERLKNEGPPKPPGPTFKRGQ